MSEPRSEPGIAFWAIVVAVVLAYPLSFGPACWARSRAPKLEIWHVVSWVHYPILVAWNYGPKPVRRAIKWYANLGAAVEVWMVQAADGSLE
jgi:hypothetical protein